MKCRKEKRRTCHAYKDTCKPCDTLSSGMKPSIEPSAAVSATKLPEGLSDLPPYIPSESPKIALCKPEDKPEDPESEKPEDGYIGEI